MKGMLRRLCLLVFFIIPCGSDSRFHTCQVWKTLPLFMQDMQQFHKEDILYNQTKQDKVSENL